jgi:hypothetical protein
MAVCRVEMSETPPTMGRMQQSELTVRRTTEADWPAVRDLRLEMVQDTPIAFGETFETALAVPESEWRMRAARGSSPSSLGLAAIVDERWVGTMGAYVPAGSGALLVGVYVSARPRRGVGARARHHPDPARALPEHPGTRVLRATRFRRHRAHLSVCACPDRLRARNGQAARISVS